MFWANNAGVYDFKPLEAVDVEHFDRQFNLNVLGFDPCDSGESLGAIPAETGGSVVNVGSVAGKLAMPGGSGRHAGDQGGR